MNCALYLLNELPRPPPHSYPLTTSPNCGYTSSNTSASRVLSTSPPSSASLTTRSCQTCGATWMPTFCLARPTRGPIWSTRTVSSTTRPSELVRFSIRAPSVNASRRCWGRGKRPKRPHSFGYERSGIRSKLIAVVAVVVEECLPLVKVGLNSGNSLCNSNSRH